MATNTLLAVIETGNNAMIDRRALMNRAVAAATVTATGVTASAAAAEPVQENTRKVKLELGDGFRVPAVTPMTALEWEEAKMVASLFDKSLSRAQKVLALEMIRRAQDLIDMGVDLEIWVQRNNTV